MAGYVAAIVAAGVLGIGPFAAAGGSLPLRAHASGALPATATVSSRSPGARRVALTLGLPAELQCGRFSAWAITVRFPRAMHLPRRIARRAVRVGGVEPRAVTVHRSSVRLRLRSSAGRIRCFSLRLGTVPIVFTKRADLRNPARAGAYGIAVSAFPHGRWQAVLRIS